MNTTIIQALWKIKYNKTQKADHKNRSDNVKEKTESEQGSFITFN